MGRRRDREIGRKTFAVSKSLFLFENKFTLFTFWRDNNGLLNSDRLLIVGFLIAAIILYTSGLGDMSLRDWDEGIVAAVARNIWRGKPGSHTWLYPTINYGEPYWNKPPLIHWLIALSYSLFGVSEWSTRLFPAILSACSIPLVYLIGREVFPRPLTAVLSALVYLTLLPIARHGRVAMLDGAIACWFCLAVWCLLRGRKFSVWLFGTGLSLGLVCLTKGIMMGVLLGAIILIFVVWDSPKLFRHPKLWIGLVLGIIPAIAWYGMQYLHYGEQFLGTSLGTQTFNRIWEPISKAHHPPWYYLLEIAKYSLPWLIFLPNGIRLALSHRHTTWGKLTLVWTGVYLMAISLMVTKLPWYVIPIYPGLSLLVGAALSRAWQKNQFPYFWRVCLSLVAIICWLASAYYGLFDAAAEIDLLLVLLVLAIGITFASALLWLHSHYFSFAVGIGFYLALLLLFNSSHWLWEVNEAFPVKPVAQMLKQHTAPLQKIYTSYPYFRPALNFYSDRVIIPNSEAALQQVWQQPELPYFLVTSDVLSNLNLADQEVLASSVSWQLITRRGN